MVALDLHLWYICHALMHYDYPLHYIWNMRLMRCGLGATFGPSDVVAAAEIRGIANMTYLSDEQEPSTGLTQAQAEWFAEWHDDYRARKMHGQWVVWCDASDHCVEFDQI
jgi:hypothetical protein